MKTALRKNLGLTLVVSLIVTMGGLALVMRHAGATVTVPAGYDTFTTPNDAQTFDDFSSHPLPADFFGRGSLAYKGSVALKGGPAVNQNRFGSADTVIQRVSSVDVPGTTDLSVEGLSFVSASPITVQYANGSSETWDVSVGKSTAVVSKGSMNFRNDGTFDSTLAIYPKYTFTRTGRTPLTFDTGAAGGSAPINLSSNNGTWSQSGSVTVINPGSEQSLLASHHITPAPTPCPSPAPAPTATVVPGGGIERSAGANERTANKAITPCFETTTTQTPAQQ